MEVAIISRFFVGYRIGLGIISDYWIVALENIGYKIIGRIMGVIGLAIELAIYLVL